METIFPVKFKGKLNIDQIERFVDVCMEFAAEIKVDVTFVRGRKEREGCSNCNLPHVSVSLLSDLPENKPLYKDSGLWQLRSDDMDEVIIQQHSEESDEAFLEKCREIQREKERNER